MWSGTKPPRLSNFSSFKVALQPFWRLHAYAKAMLLQLITHGVSSLIYIIDRSEACIDRSEACNVSNGLYPNFTNASARFHEDRKTSHLLQLS